MKIPPATNANTRNSYIKQLENERQVTSEASAREAPPEQDQAEISQEAQAIQTLGQVADELPEVRVDKIAEIQERLARGEYRINSRGIAERLLERAAKISS